MEKVIFLFVLSILLLSMMGTAQAIKPDVTFIDVTYQRGGTQPTPIIINFENDVNGTVQKTITKSGTASNFLSIIPSQLTLQPFSSDFVTVSFSIPNSTEVGLYRADISYEDGVIPVFITVQESVVSECRINPIVTSDIKRIAQNAMPITQTYNILVSNGCINGVEITNIFLMDTIQTAEGEKPIRLSGGQSLGHKNPGEQASFTIEFDVSGLTTGTYLPYIRIVGTYDGNPISTTITFSITVLGSVQPVSGVLTPPEFDVPSQVKAGETFEIEAKKLDPNLDVYLFPNQNLIGEKVEVLENKWIWSGYMNNTGEFDIQLVSLYRGGQIGGVKTFKIKVVGIEYSGGYGNLTLEIYPSTEEIKDGDTINILCRDSKTNDIIGCKLYVNGEEKKNNSLVVYSGTEYCISATAEGYSTVDKCIEIELKKLAVFITPESPDVGDTVTVEVKDPVTGDYIEEPILTFDGYSVKSGFIVDKSGNHTISASKIGYKSGSVSFFSKEAVSLVYSPESIYLKQNVTVQLSDNISWSVTYSEDPNSDEVPINQGFGKYVIFTPEKNGIYYINIKGMRAKAYQIQGISIPTNMVYLIGLIIFIIVILYIIKKSRKRRSYGYGFIPEKQETVVS